MSILRNAFYAQAIADGMGAKFEIKNPTAKEVRKFINGTAPLHITGDTQMALFGQEAVNLAAHKPGLKHLAKCTTLAYLRWYRTQTEQRTVSGTETGLLSLPEMWAVRVRAPGAQCMSALRALSNGHTSVTANGAGCGGVMRLLPFAALYLVDQRKTIEDVRKACYMATVVTHSEPSAILASDMYVDTALHLLGCGNPRDLLVSGKKITDCGRGWLAWECVRMAMWAVKHADSYDHLLELAISHDGDSDSVAAVAGSLWGLAGLGGFERHLPRLHERAAIDSVTGGV